MQRLHRVIFLLKGVALAILFLLLQAMFATTIRLLPRFSGSQQLSIQARTAAHREDADGARSI